MEIKTFYNDNEPFAVSWLDCLQLLGEIPPGAVSGESIKDLEAWQLAQYTQAHFFAGIGGWPYAFRLAGWPEHIRTWTGSCPCQPFSVAGKRKGVNDDRHLWPVWFQLIRECLPDVLFGEQVSSKDGRLWLAGVQADLEALGYRFWAVDTCAAGVGAPHIRQRLYWMAVSRQFRSGRGVQRSAESSVSSKKWAPNQLGGSGGARGVEYSDLSGEHGRPSVREQPLRDEYGQRSSRVVESQSEQARNAGLARIERNAGSGMADDDDKGLQRHRRHDERSGECAPGQDRAVSYWDRYELIPCADGKARRIEPGTFPLAHGVPRRMDKLRGYGNAIVPPLAAEFVKTVMDVLKIH